MVIFFLKINAADLFYAFLIIIITIATTWPRPRNHIAVGIVNDQDSYEDHFTEDQAKFHPPYDVN